MRKYQTFMTTCGVPGCAFRIPLPIEVKESNGVYYVRVPDIPTGSYVTGVGEPTRKWHGCGDTLADAIERIRKYLQEVYGVRPPHAWGDRDMCWEAAFAREWLVVLPRRPKDLL